MRKPDFFIVGAPKSGTTALATYLGEHPRVFFCPEKEPNYFCEDYPGIQLARTEREYLHYFRDAVDVHLAVGEGSIRYMYSSVALDRIRAFRPDARIILLLRNPIDLVFSFHSQVVFSLYETEDCFERAWHLQAERAQGHGIPTTCPEPFFLQYRELGMLGRYVGRVLQVFPHNQVRVWLFDDFVQDTKAVYEQVLEFIGVPSDGRTGFPLVNERKRLRNWQLGWLVEHAPRRWLSWRRRVYRALGVDGFGLLEPLRRWNAVPQKRPPLRSEFRKELAEAFRADIAELSDVIGRDLSFWA